MIWFPQQVYPHFEAQRHAVFHSFNQRMAQHLRGGWGGVDFEKYVTESIWPLRNLLLQLPPVTEEY